MTPDERHRLAAEYVVGLLEGEERGLVERMLTSDDGFQGNVEQWSRRFAEWDDTAAELPADEELWQRIDAELTPLLHAKDRTAISLRQSASSGLLHSLWESLAFWRTFGLAGAVA